MGTTRMGEIRKSFLGIDPGASGGLVLLDEYADIVLKEVMPMVGKDLDTDEVAATLDHVKDLGCTVILERIKGFAMSQGTSFVMGKHFGMLELLIRQSKIPVIYVEPVKWCKQMHQGIDANLKPKAKSLIAVQRLFPTANLKATEKCKKPHEGLIDALLIAEWGRTYA
jgi:hypothetical protein